MTGISHKITLANLKYLKLRGIFFKFLQNLLMRMQDYFAQFFKRLRMSTLRRAFYHFYRLDKYFFRNRYETNMKLVWH